MTKAIDNQGINKKLNKLSRKIQIVIDELAEFSEEIDEIKEEAKHFENKSGIDSYEGLNLIVLRDALCAQGTIKNQLWVPKFISTTGSGPWESLEFDNFLEEYGFNLYQMPSNGVDCLILGANEWDEELLSEQIYNRSADDLKIYTQELFIFGLIISRDPYEVLEQDAIDKIASLHQAIRYILERKFVWPSWPKTSSNDDVVVGDKFKGIDWAKESVLKVMGYSANFNGPSTYDRQLILRKAFELDLPQENLSSEQRERWGAKKSADRLYAISHFLAWLISFQGSDKHAAKAKWEEDLEWLKRTFYSKTMKFNWPEVLDFKSNTERSASRPPWPFQSIDKIKRSSAENKLSSNSNFQHVYLKKPSNALAKIVGASSLTEAEALTELEYYISKKNLAMDDVFIRCDLALTALSGKHTLTWNELTSLIRSNLK